MRKVTDPRVRANHAKPSDLLITRRLKKPCGCGSTMARAQGADVKRPWVCTGHGCGRFIAAGNVEILAPVSPASTAKTGPASLAKAAREEWRGSIRGDTIRVLAGLEASADRVLAALGAAPLGKTGDLDDRIAAKLDAIGEALDKSDVLTKAADARAAIEARLTVLEAARPIVPSVLRQSKAAEMAETVH